MTKKKTTKKKVVKAPRRVSTPVETTTLTSSSRRLKFVVVDETDNQLAEFEDDLYKFHRMIVLAQADTEVGDDYIPTFQKSLRQNYGVAISEEVCYKIAWEVCVKFEEQKKTSSG